MAEEEPKNTYGATERMNIPMACSMCGTIWQPPAPPTCEHTNEEWVAHWTAYPELNRSRWMHTVAGKDKLKAILSRTVTGKDVLEVLLRDNP